MPIPRTPPPVNDAAVLRAVRAALASGAADVDIVDIVAVLSRQQRQSRITETIRDAYARHLDAIENALHATMTAGIRRGYRLAGLDTGLNLVNPSSVRYAQARAAELVVQILQSQREVLRVLVARGVRDGFTVEQTARLIRATVGLDTRLANAVARFRAGLLAKGKTAGQANQMASRYAQRLRNYRARMIARTETVIAQNVGQEQLWRVAVRDGFLRRATMRVWLIAQDERTCPICRPMDGQRVRIDEPFMTPTGVPVYTPGMTHPHCRCSEYLDMTG